MAEKYSVTPVDDNGTLGTPDQRWSAVYTQRVDLTPTGLNELAQGVFANDDDMPRLTRNKNVKVGDIAYSAKLQPGLHLVCIQEGTTDVTLPMSLSSALVVDDIIIDGTAQWKVAKYITSAEATAASTDSPAFTGTPTAPTPADDDRSSKLATTEYVQRTIDLLGLGNYAPLYSPIFAGTPKAPTPVAADDSTNIATTEFVHRAINDLNINDYALLDSPTFTGTPTVPTPSSVDNSTRVATTEYVRGLLNGYATKSSATMTGTPTATTPPTNDVSNRIATTAYTRSVLTEYAPLHSPELTGTPLAPTPLDTSDSNQIATTAFVRALINAHGGGIASASLTVNGYIKFINGLIIQWGKITRVGASVTVVFPCAFAEECLNIQLLNNMAYDGAYAYMIANSNNDRFTLVDNPELRPNSLNTRSAYWLAIGV